MNQARPTQARNHARLTVPALIAIMLAGAAADVLFAADAEHANLFGLPAFWSVFGLLGCCALAGVCKLAARFLKRPENYYDDVL